MRKLILVLSVLLVCGAARAQQAKLHGSLKELRMNPVTMSYTGSAAEVYGNRNISLALDEDGRFAIAPAVDRPAYYKVSQSIIYLTPGDDLEVAIGRSVTGASFAGKGSAANNYLKGYRWYDKSNLGIAPTALLPLERVMQKADSAMTIREAELAALTDVSDAFRRQEQARLTANKIAVYFGNIYTSEFYKWDDSPEVKALKRIEYFKSIARDINPLLARIDRNEAFLEVSDVREALLECYGAGCFEMHASERLKELARTIGVCSRMDEGIMRSTLDTFRDYASQINDPELREAFEAKLASRTRLMEGTPAPDIALRDIDGRASLLSNHTGEVLFIDLWATWCLPCLAQAPHVKALSEKYPGIRFIAISVDQDESKWRNKLLADTRHGAVRDYITDVFKVGVDWDITTIPRFLLIDRDFTIISAFGPRPSDTKLIEPLLETYSTR